MFAHITKSALRSSLVLAVGIALATAATAGAQTTDNSWHFTFAPYMMGASLDGNAALMGRETDVEISTEDIFDNLDYGILAVGAVRKGNWGLLADFVWMDLGVSSDMPPVDFEPAIGIGSLSIVRQITPYADVTAGARWNHLIGRASFRAPPLAGLEVSRNRNWVDPIVGVHLRTPGASKWRGDLVADIGGFGAGSDLTWQVFPSGGYEMAKHVSLQAGYRLLSVDYKSNSGSAPFEYDILYKGPVAGLAFRF